MSKSHVSMEQHQCPVCGETHNTGTILLHKKLKATLEQYTVTGQSFCPEHQKLKDEGYIALIEIDNKTRTGSLAHVRATAWSNIFDQPVPPQGIAFVEIGVLAMLQAKVPVP